MYPCDEQIGYASLHDRCTYRGFDVRLRASAMSLEQYRAHYALYADKSSVYVKKSWMYRASSCRAAPAPVVHVGDAEHGEFDSYAVSEEPFIPLASDDDGDDPGV